MATTDYFLSPLAFVSHLHYKLSKSYTSWRLTPITLALSLKCAVLKIRFYINSFKKKMCNIVDMHCFSCSVKNQSSTEDYAQKWKNWSHETRLFNINCDSNKSWKQCQMYLFLAIKCKIYDFDLLNNCFNPSFQV